MSTKQGKSWTLEEDYFVYVPKRLKSTLKFMKNGVFMDILNKKMCICPKMCDETSPTTNY